MCALLGCNCKPSKYKKFHHYLLLTSVILLQRAVRNIISTTFSRLWPLVSMHTGDGGTFLLFFSITIRQSNHIRSIKMRLAEWKVSPAADDTRAVRHQAVNKTRWLINPLKVLRRCVLCVRWCAWAALVSSWAPIYPPGSRITSTAAAGHQNKWRPVSLCCLVSRFHQRQLSAGRSGSH